jgi:hypothetical protein
MMVLECVLLERKMPVGILDGDARDRESAIVNFSQWRLAMESFPDLSTEAKCRELLDRYPDTDEPLNVFQVAVFDDLDAPFIEAKPPA